MSYQIEEIEKATAECKPLRSRGGVIINADALANNPNCNKKPPNWKWKDATEIGKMLGTPYNNNQAKPNNKMAWIIGGIAVAGIAY